MENFKNNFHLFKEFIDRNERIIKKFPEIQLSGWRGVGTRRMFSYMIKDYCVSQFVYHSDIKVDVSWGENSLDPSQNVAIINNAADLIINYETYNGYSPYIMKGKPTYLIKCSSDITEVDLLDNILINNIDLDEEESYYEFDNGQTGTRKIVYGGIYGSYHKHNIKENDIILDGKTFKLSDGNLPVKAYNAYIFVDKINNSFMGDIKLSIDDVIINGYTKN